MKLLMEGRKLPANHSSSTHGHDIVVIGASAGGLEIVAQIVQRLPRDLPAAIFVVIHTGPDTPGVLPQILSRHGSLPAKHASEAEPIKHGQIYCAPPDYHLLVERGQVRALNGPKENGFRPAIDPLFRTATSSGGHAKTRCGPACCASFCSLRKRRRHLRSKTKNPGAMAARRKQRRARERTSQRRGESGRKGLFIGPCRRHAE